MAPPTRPRRSTDTPPPPGVTRTAAGTEVAVVAAHATAVQICLFDGVGERRIPLRHRAHDTWWDTVPELVPGARYGFRVEGPWAPEEGHRHNPAKLLLDPYGHGVEGWVHWEPEVYGHVVDESGHASPQSRDPRDSAPFVPRSVVLDHDFDWGGDVLPAVPWSETVLYEAHVRGLTMRHPQVPAHLQGTYAALGHPAIVEHLRSLGVTTLELLPVHAFTSEPTLVRQGLHNYWGYNTLGFFAPHPGYAAANDPQGVADELRAAIRSLHAAGIEVLLDVVYNHTAEQASSSGPTLCWRGLDNRSYYRLDGRGRDIDVTGTGNTLDVREPAVVRMILDSLRHWVENYHVDGFRFDLGPALARGRDDGYDRDHPFLVALRTDPVLSRVKLIVEPWDVGVHGWRTGQFPPPFAEWNDRYRDAVRTFWLADVQRGLHGEPGHGLRELATRIAGSADMFASGDRGPVASVNLLTAHDGFTLADLTAYNQKHNYANGEDNRDGHNDNRSWNHGVEGSTTDGSVLAARNRSIRNLLGTLVLSAGVPMLVAGDEMGRTQEGNNNAYNQDNQISWVRWRLRDWQQDLLDDTRDLLALRRELALVRTARFPTHDAVRGRTRLRWYTQAGHVVDDGRWGDPWQRSLVAVLDTLHEGGQDREPDGPDPVAGRRQAVAVVLHGGPDRLDAVAPMIEGVGAWRRRWSSEADPAGPVTVAAGETVPVGPTSLTVLVGVLGDGVRAG